MLYAYDALSRLISVTDWDANVTTYAYDELGNVDQITRPDGSTAVYGYDRAGRLLSIVDSNPSLAEPTLFQADFTLDAAGRRVDATLDLPLDPTLEPSATFSYDDANRLVARDGEVFAYDADGNLISGSLGGSSRTLEYNALNQLVAIDGGAEILRYDADGRRASRQVGATTTFYVYDTAGRLLEEVDDSGAVTARYVHGLGLISRQDTAQEQAGAGEVSVYHFDSRGSTLALTDSVTGAITDVYAYSPFGGVQRDPMNATPNPFTYNGRDGVVDDDNGLYYMQARYYAPELMRFVQKDPVYDGELALPQSLNRYAFVEGNPIEKIDPTGEFGVFSAVVGAVVGATVGAVTAIAEGKSFEEVLISAAIGAAVGAASSIGLGSAVAASFAGGFLQAGGDISNRLEGGAFDAVGALAFGGLGKFGGKALAKSGLGKRLAGSKLATSFSTTALGRKALPITAASRRLFTQAGSAAGRSGRRGAVRSVSRRSVAREAITGVFEEGGTSFLGDPVQGVGVFVGKRLAGLARDAQDGYLAQTFRSTPALFERSRYESISFGPVR